MRRAGTIMSNTISQEARDLIQFIHLIEFYVLIINENEYILLYFKDGVCVHLLSAYIYFVSACFHLLDFCHFWQFYHLRCFFLTH